MADEKDKNADLTKLQQVAEEAGLADDPAFSNAMADLAQMIQPLMTDAQFEVALYYLLLLWNAFHIYPLGPDVDPQGNQLPQTAEPGSRTVKITTIENGYTIHDYGYCLSTSAGGFYGSTSTGRLIEAVQKMVRMLAEKGVTQVSFLGHPIAKRAAWMECLSYGMDIINYEPSYEDWEVYRRIIDLKANVTLANAGLRPE